MPLRACDDCRHLISTDNAVCPSCGKSHPAVDATQSTVEAVPPGEPEPPQLPEIAVTAQPVVGPNLPPRPPVAPPPPPRAPANGTSSRTGSWGLPAMLLAGAAVALGAFAVPNLREPVRPMARDDRAAACVQEAARCQSDCEQRRASGVAELTANGNCAAACLQSLTACVDGREAPKAALRPVEAAKASAPAPAVPAPAAPADATPGRPPSTGGVPEAAVAHFARGKSAFEAGDYARAVEEFRDASEIEPTPVLDFNIALAYEKVGKPVPAIRFYKRYLREVPTAPNRAEVESKIAAMVE